MKYKFLNFLGQTSKPGSPAYTILYNLGIHGKRPIDVDLVPAIRIECWPKPAKEIKPDWVKKETTDRATRRFHAVMKTYPESMHTFIEFIFAFKQQVLL